LILLAKAMAGKAGGFFNDKFSDGNANNLSSPHG
jgi:hypothetical protein